MLDPRRACPACSATDDFNLVYRIPLRTPDGHPLQGGYDLVSCTQCGCAFANDDAAEYYVQYYANLAKYAHEAEIIGEAGALDAPWQRMKADAAAARIAALVPDRTKRVLDVGCNTGSVLAALARLGYQHLVGVDPSPEAVSRGSRRAGLTLHCGSIADVADLTDGCDLLIMTGVLEHLWDPQTAISRLRDQLNSKGAMYLEVPDASRYLDPYVAPFEDVSTEHINHFWPATLNVLASSQQLHQVWSGRFCADIAPGIPASHVAVLWNVDSSTGDTFIPDKDEESLGRFGGYITRSQQDFAALQRQLEDDLVGEGAFGIWGVGELAFKLLALPPLAERELTLAVDGNLSRHSYIFNGVRVEWPRSITRKDVPILISSFVHATGIVRDAKLLGISNKLVALRLSR